jgi:hypothetical protein
MERVHKEVYGPDGKWQAGDQPARPTGIKNLTVNGVSDIWPSWFNPEKNSGVVKETLAFNKYNHLLAASCTPSAYKIEVEVTKITDPMTGKDNYKVPEPYDKETEDPCTYTPPEVALSTSGSKIVAVVRKGSSDIAGYSLYINGVEKEGVSLGANGAISGYTLDGSESSIKFTVTDKAGYTATGSLTLTPSHSSNASNSSSSSNSNNSSSNNSSNEPSTPEQPGTGDSEPNPASQNPDD